MLVRVDVDVVTRNNVTPGGRADGQPIVFAHGYGCDQNMWRFVAPAFEGRYRTIMFDFVGAGGSDLSAYDLRRCGSLDGYATDVIDVIRALDLHDVIFVGGRGGRGFSRAVGAGGSGRGRRRGSRLPARSGPR
jgi:sigma-B regulation protein RsbQ